MMNAALMVALIDQETPLRSTPVGCPKPETARIGGGQGIQMGLRRPFYNDMSHDITDSTWFRCLLIFVVGHYVYNTFLER